MKTHVLFDKLAEQCYVKTGSVNTDHFDYVKFGELIVTECTQLLFEESERLHAYASECDSFRESDEAESCAEKCIDNIEMIEKHFGIE